MDQTNFTTFYLNGGYDFHVHLKVAVSKMYVIFYYTHNFSFIYINDYTICLFYFKVNKNICYTKKSTTKWTILPNS